MTFLLQAETTFLFWGQYEVLWFVIVALGVALALFIRTGIRTFNREEILAREIDELNLGAAWQLFRKFLFGERFSLVRIYRDIPRLLRENLQPIITTGIVIFGSMALGWWVSVQYPLPEGMIADFKIDPATFQQQLESPALGILPRIDTISIFTNNVRALGIASLLALFSFGSLALLLLMIPVGIIGFFTAQASRFGTDPFTFLVAFILPHGIVELPAAILATAFALRMGASIIAPPPGVSAGENLIHALADWIKLFVFVLVPMLLLAAWIESTITPQVVIWFYGR
jgi:uncharacterized membrane protein SpoIIM required for sporulation